MNFVEDFFLFEDDSYKKKSFILGSIRNNISIKVNYQQFCIISEIYNLGKDARNQMTDAEIEKAVFDKLKVKICFQNLLKHLSDKGLLEGSKCKMNHSEVKMMGVPIYSFTIEKISPFFVKLADFLGKFKWLQYVVIFFGLIIFIINFNIINESLNNNLFKYNNSAVLGLGISIILSFIIIFMHEIAHVLEAVRQRMNQVEFCIILYAGFIPMYYTRYSQFIKLKAKSKIMILFAGLRTNIAALFLCLGIMGMKFPVSVLNVSGLIILVNLNFIIINLSPFAMNDGYYILITRLGLNGLRVKMWQFLIGLFKKNESINVKNKILFIGYTIISLCFIVLNLRLTIEWISKIVIEILNFSYFK